MSFLSERRCVSEIGNTGACEDEFPLSGLQKRFYGRAGVLFRSHVCQLWYSGGCSPSCISLLPFRNRHRLCFLDAGKLCFRHRAYLFPELPLVQDHLVKAFSSGREYEFRKRSEGIEMRRFKIGCLQQRRRM
jgi:hypothetical protein